MSTRAPGNQRRKQVIDAAMAVLGERGVAQLRLVDVARTAGVSVGLVQHYFGTRDALLWETFMEATEQSVEALHAVAETEPDPRRRLHRFIREALSAPRWPVWLEYWGAAHRIGAVRDHCEEQYQRWSAPFLEAIEEGIAAGEFEPDNPPQDIADRIVALIDGFAVRLLVGDPRIDCEEAIRLASQRLDSELGFAGDG